nr:hypothetical protein HAGR004_19490 [Bdellovibrio sp. HAGR004]
MRKRQSKLNSAKIFRIAIYTRVSTEEQAENPEGSIKNQELRLREYVNLKNLVEPFGEIVSVFSDPGVSAKDMKRPAFQKMLRAIENHEIDLVLVTELSRFSRSTKDFALLQEFLKEHECKFMSIRENFDTSGAAGSMVLNLMASIAEFERKQTAERVSNSFLARAKRGLYNGGSIPLGYRAGPDKSGTLVIEPEEANLVNLIFNTYLKEKTLAATCKWLTSNKIQLPREIRGAGNPRAKYLRLENVYRILGNKAYIGIRVYSTKTGTEETRAVWQPIVDKGIFEKVQKLLKENCSRRKTHDNKYPYLLSGITFCKECGERMSGASATSHTGKKFGYYEHLATKKNEAVLEEKLLKHSPRRVPAEKLEIAVWAEVKKFVLDRSFTENLLARAKAISEKTSVVDDSKELALKIGALERQIAVLAERISRLPEDMDIKPIVDQMKDLQSKKSGFVEKSKMAKEKVEVQMPLKFETHEIFKSGLENLIKKGENDPKMRSDIIKLIVHKIEIQKDGFEIHFHVGQAHYENALKGQTLGATFFVYVKGIGWVDKSEMNGIEIKGSKKTKETHSVVAGPNNGFSNFGKQSQKLNFFKRVGSSRLTSGANNWTRTSDLFHVKEARYQLRYIRTIQKIYLNSADAAIIDALGQGSRFPEYRPMLWGSVRKGDPNDRILHRSHSEWPKSRNHA